MKLQPITLGIVAVTLFGVLVVGNLWMSRYEVQPFGERGFILHDRWQQTVSACGFDREAGTDCFAGGPL